MERSPASLRARLAALALAGLCASAQAAAAGGYVSTRGNQFVDGAGAPVKMTCIGWPGANYGLGVPVGLEATRYTAILDEAKAMGFNCIRFSWSDDALGVTAAQLQASGAVKANPDLQGKSALQVWDALFAYGNQVGLKFVLARMWQNGNLYDFKGRGSSQTTLPYDTSGFCSYLRRNGGPACYGRAQVQSDLVAVARRYDGNDAVIGIELWNEVNDNAKIDYAHNMEGRSTWGSGTAATDLRQLAAAWGNAVLAANPDVVVMVEGMQTWSSFAALGQSDLSMVPALPVALNAPAKLAYTFHEYPQYQPQESVAPRGQPQPPYADPHAYFMKQFGDAYNAGYPVWCSEMGISDDYLGWSNDYLAEYTDFLAFIDGDAGGIQVPQGGLAIGWMAWALDVNVDFSSDPFDMLGKYWPGTIDWNPADDPNAPMLAPLLPTESNSVL